MQPPEQRKGLEEPGSGFGARVGEDRSPKSPATARELPVSAVAGLQKQGLKMDRKASCPDMAQGAAQGFASSVARV